jgi:2'-phosphotransferase
MLLRHRARDVGVAIDNKGWVVLEDALKWINNIEDGDEWEGGFVTVDEVCTVVAESDKPRFQLQADLECVSSADVPFAVHGTYYEAWDSIRQTGLRRMKRSHIHMARDVVPGSSGVISGMRSSCQAEKGGITFLQSSNGVILSEGIDGVIDPAFFEQVIDRQTGAPLYRRGVKRKGAHYRDRRPRFHSS